MKNMSKIRVQVKTVTSKLFSFDVLLTDTVYSLKTKIQKKQGAPVTKQILMYQNKQLQNETALKK